MNKLINLKKQLNKNKPQAVIQPVIQPINQTMNQPMKQTINQPMNQTIIKQLDRFNTCFFQN